MSFTELNTLQSETAAALNELYTTDVSAETLIIDSRSIPGSLTFALSEVELMAAGWNEDVKGVFTTLKQYFPTGKWPRVLKSECSQSVNGVVQKYQVKQLQGNNDMRAQLLVGVGSFGNSK